ncbi:RNA methyltransferase, TrmH family [Burkholderiales bacterium GJ-E10]|nr:RNA methyltransferase, TrmH family [Burkholderiales bacterium GJ-E10]
MIEITSESNPSYRRWLRVATAPRAVREFGQALAEGLHLAQAARDAGFPVDAILLRRGAAQGAVAAMVQDLLRARAASGGSPLPCYEIAPALYDRIAPVERGAGLTLLVPVPRPERLHAADEDLLYLDGVQDPGNAGTLLRTAAAAGIRHVLASANTAGLWAPKVLRSGMGAHFRIAIHEHVAAHDLPAMLRGEWIAAVAHGAATLWETDLPAGGPVGWILGGEGAGITAESLAVCARRVCIPTSGSVESLNVAAAAAVCLFERRRRVVDLPASRRPDEARAASPTAVP